MTMIRHTGLAAAAALALALGACASAPLYAPQASERTSGYAEQKLDGTHARVTFAGRRSTSRARVEDGLMYRAAELTQQSGFSHFIIDKRETEQERLGTRSSLWGGPSAFGPWGPGYGFGYGRYSWYDPFWFGPSGWYGGYGRDFDDERYVASADVSMLTAAEARGNPEAVEAAAVIANLHDKVIPPAKP